MVSRQAACPLMGIGMSYEGMTATSIGILEAQQRHAMSGQYCTNCKCNGCAIHRQRLDAQINQAQAFSTLHSNLGGTGVFSARPGQIFEYNVKTDAIEFDKPIEPDDLGAQTDKKFAEEVPEKRRFPWKYLGYVMLIAVGLQLVARVCGRIV